MATVGPSKRSSRLAARDPSVKATYERKLKSGNAINKGVQKVNVNTRSKKLGISVKDTSHNNSQPLSKRLRPRKNKKNYCEDSKLLQLHISAKQQNSIVMLEKLNLTDKKLPVYKTIKSSEKSSEKKSNDVYAFICDGDDSQRKVTKKRQRKKNVNKAKGKVKKTILKKVAKKQAKVMSNKTNKPPELEVNLPAETIQCSPSTAESVITKSTKESILKKSKTPKINTSIKEVEELVEVISKTVVAKSTRESIVEKPETPEMSANIEKLEESEENISQAETLKLYPDTQATQKTIKEDTVKVMETSGLVSQIAGEWENEDTDMEILKKDTDIKTREDTSSAGKTVANKDPKKPRIISNENADNIVITNSPPKNIENLRPFRSKNLSRNKTPMKESINLLNCSLLTKSLSPILKTTNALNTESPLCPETSMFSETKHFVQSTPNINFKMCNMKVEKDEGSAEMDKENIDVNKKNKNTKHKGRKKQEVSIYRKLIHSKKPPNSQNQISENVQTCAKKSVVKPAPTRILLGEMKNLLQTNEKDINVDKKQIKPDINENNKQTTHAETDTSIPEKKILVDLINFSDTFDIMTEDEKQSKSGIDDVPLFMDFPSHFVEPPQRLYKRKRGVRFNVSQESSEEEEEEEKTKRAKKKKLTKSEKEHMQKVDNWVKSINSTFEEIDKYDLLVEKYK